MEVNESNLPHPLEKPVFIASVALNLCVMIAAVMLIGRAHGFLAGHPVLKYSAEEIRTYALIALFAVPGIGIIRNVRHGFVRGNSIQLSRTQFPQLYRILEKHCARLGLKDVPELYLSHRAIQEPARAYSVFRHEFIVLGYEFLEEDPNRNLDVISFTMGRELGRIRLGYTRWWYELLLSYVIRIPLLMNPMRRMEAFSLDRYGAFLEPGGLRGLVIEASGRRVLDSVNLDTYLHQVITDYDGKGFWDRLANLTKETPHLSYRINALLKTGFLAGQPVSIASPPKDLPAA